MKKNKKKAALVLVILLVFVMAVPAFASGNDGEDFTYNDTLYRLNDFTGTLSQSEIDDIDDVIYNSIPEDKFDYPVILADTDSYAEETDLFHYADYLYTRNDFGYGSSHDGMILVADIEKGSFVVLTYGRGIDIFTPEVLDRLSIAFRTQAAGGDYTEAVTDYYELASGEVRKAAGNGMGYDPAVSDYPEKLTYGEISFTGPYESPYGLLEAASGGTIEEPSPTPEAVSAGSEEPDNPPETITTPEPTQAPADTEPSGNTLTFLPDWFPADTSSFEFFHDENAPRVVDNADILSASEEAELSRKIDEFRKAEQKDLVIYTDVTSYGFSRAVLAADFYDFNGYGYGPERDGAVIFICMESGNRGWWTCCTGNSVRSLYTESTANKIDDHLEPFMVDGEYAEGLSGWVDDMSGLLSKGHLPRTKMDYIIRAVGSAVVGLIIGAIATAIRGSSMKTVAKAVEAGNYIEPGSFQMHFSRDVFTHTTRTEVYDPPSKDSGGSSGSGGRSSYSSSYSGHSGSSHSGSGRSF